MQAGCKPAEGCCIAAQQVVLALLVQWHRRLR